MYGSAAAFTRTNEAEINGRRDTGQAEATRMTKPAFIEPAQSAQLKAGVHTGDDGAPRGVNGSTRRAEAVIEQGTDGPIGNWLISHRVLTWY